MRGLIMTSCSHCGFCLIISRWFLVAITTFVTESVSLHENQPVHSNSSAATVPPSLANVQLHEAESS